MKKTILNVLMANVVLLSGCSMTMGNYGTNSHFAFPNSNITPLGEVKASTSKLGILTFPDFDGEDVILLSQEAIKQKAGAELLLNYSVDTKVTIFPLVTKMDITITGTAAKVQVGTQELRSFYDKVQYKMK